MTAQRVRRIVGGLSLWSCVLALGLPDARGATEVRKYVEATATRQGLLGFAASIYGDVAFAGAPAGTRLAGLGYVFDVDTGDLMHKLVPSVQRTDSMFGFNSKMYGDRLLVGDPANPFARTKLAGAAYVFDPVTGAELRRMQPTDSFGGDEFGFGINMFEDTAIIGAPNLGTGVGAAYLFDVNTGVQLRKLQAADPLAGSEFGADVAVSSNYAVVGAPMNFDTLGFVPGSAYVFDAQTGNQLHKLQPADSFGGDEFGFDVAISGHIAVIGAPNGGSGLGAAYLYDAATGNQLFKLEPHDNVVGNDFGSTVDIFGDIVAVGASGLSAVLGAVYLFDANTGLQLDKITPSDLESGDAFGISVSLYQDRLFVGSARDDETNLNAGAAYLFELGELPIPGDFNLDRALDVIDIDLLTRAVIDNSTDPLFDVSGNGDVGPEDRDVWINDLFGSYYGDADLDGEFNSTDLIVMLQSGEYEDLIPGNSSWGTGDFTGDLEFDTGDLILALQTGAYEQGPRFATAVQAVPEPASMALLLAALPWLRRRR